MNLGLSGRTALICASSRGLGFACASAFAREGCHVVINGRDPAVLREARDTIAVHGGTVIPVIADVATAEGRAALMAAAPTIDILVTNNGGPAPGRYDRWDEDAWIAALQANMLAAILLITQVVPGMRARRFGRIVNITSAMVKSPQLPMGLSTASRAGLTAFAKALSREVTCDNVTINNLLPERIETARLQGMIARVARHGGIDELAARAEMLRPIPAGRFGTPDEFGDACAYLCSAQAGYVTGQNLQIDGGAYAGLI
ncbi:SDR family oxidoreductase [Sphingomonas sp. A2-49]|uniref:SDR family oxidoreductase n=1 Tax=Sphingomonas sp. A2-49 TaxID=1391375 RepID=UPI0021CE66D6|nr:SDR family oxidoreductase [Sphingomonas sp. A2-49]MCU6453098.1 SDR family oxidoreductase [Sphingomonas sp. A2-49]